jgi:hypothetical protein
LIYIRIPVKDKIVILMIINAFLIFYVLTAKFV